MSASIRNWLSLHVPQVLNVIVAESGKFVGLHLGRQSVVSSFAAPVKKNVNGVHEVCVGQAPAAVALLRYSQRVVLVLSYVFQFAFPPSEYQLSALAHRSIHTILRLPLKACSRQLNNSVGFRSAFNPLPIISCCALVRYRFAASEADYLSSLKEDLFKF